MYVHIVLLVFVCARARIVWVNAGVNACTRECVCGMRRACVFIVQHEQYFRLYPYSLCHPKGTVNIIEHDQTVSSFAPHSLQLLFITTAVIH